MTLKTIIALSIGTCAMLIPILIITIKYRIKLWKSVPVAVMLTIAGTISTYIWFFVESSWFGGRSYYGAVFLVPLAFVCFAKLMRIPYGELMDLCAPAECVMLAIMKYQCLVDGCCGGRLLYVSADGREVFFPSQIAELINALLIAAILMFVVFSNKWRGKIYPWYLVIYGGTRFVLNLFRNNLSPLLIGLPAGNLWSVLAIFIGVMWLTNHKLVNVKKYNSPNAH